MNKENLIVTSEMVQGLAIMCQKILIEKEFVCKDMIREYYIKFDTIGKLDKEPLVAATSVDNNDIPYMLFRNTMVINEARELVAHESVHLAQIFNGYYMPGFNYTTWYGAKIEKNANNDPNYKDMPWEEEAIMWAEIIIYELKK